MSRHEILRKPPRFPVDIEAHLRVLGHLDWTQAQVLNLSEGGLCLETKELFKPDQLVELYVDTLDKKQHARRRRMMARVVWGKNGRYGMQFVPQLRN